MTLAQQIKKTIRPHFENVRATMGRGTASHWVTVSFDVKKQEVCTCEQSQFGRCHACCNTMRTAQQRVYELIGELNNELSTYYVDDGYGSESDCMIIDVNLV